MTHGELTQTILLAYTKKEFLTMQGGLFLKIQLNNESEQV